MIRKRKKPDIIFMLALIFGLGATLSGMTQSESRQPLSQQEIESSGIIVSHNPQSHRDVE